MDDTSNADRTTTLAPLLDLLGQIWLHELDAPTAAIWNSAAPQLQQILDEDITHVEDSSLEHLECEYCRLFLGPQNHLPPIQSVWASGQLSSQTAASMERYLKNAGLSEIAPHANPDHIGKQLICMGQFVAHRTANRIDSEIVIREFTEAHLTWADEFLNRVMATENRFYRQVASLTHRLLLHVCDMESEPQE